MKTIFKSVILAAMAFVTTTAEANDNLLGSWMGPMSIPDGPTMRIGVEVFHKADGSFGANISSPDQGARYMYVSQMDVSETGFSALMGQMPVTITGEITADQDALNGAYSGGGMNLPITFKRVDAIPETVRPQTPSHSDKYDDQEVRVYNAKDDVWLAGTLSTPKTASAAKPAPAVLLIGGSGPTQRDVYHSGHRMFQVLAHHLAEAGFAVMRLDKRGIFKSSGDFEAANLDDLTRDAAAGVAFLAQQYDIAKNHIGVIGHSEGSMVAAMVAVGNADVSFVVSLAGPGRATLDVILEQDGDEVKAAGGSDDEAAKMVAFSRKFYQTARDTQGVEARALALQALYDNLSADDAALINKWNHRQGTYNVETASSDSFVALINSDSGPYWERVHAPVLLINGGKDVEVSADQNIPRIKKHLNDGGNTSVGVMIFPEINHMMQTAQTGATEEFGQIDETFAPVVLDDLTKWLLKNTNQPASLVF